jgi:hypothetical protein
MSAMIAFLSFIVSRRVMALDLIHWNDFYKSFAALVQGLNYIDWWNFGDSHHNLEIPLCGHFEVMVTVTEII